MGSLTEIFIITKVFSKKMRQEGYEFWNYIATYEELLDIGETKVGVLFDLYCSKKGQLWWARYDPEEYRKPPRPLKGVKANSVTLFDISWMLSHIAKNELKRPVPNSLDMLLVNAGTVSKIQDDVQTYNILRTVDIK